MVWRRGVFLAIPLLFKLGAGPALAQTAPGGADNGAAVAQPASAAGAGRDASGADFAAARHLLQLGKYDEAIAQLLELQSKKPAAPGLARELGVAYYKKSDYLNAASNLVKAQAEDPGDQEATQLLGLSYYLAGGQRRPYRSWRRCRRGTPQPMWTPRTFWGFVISRPKTIRTRARRLRRCSVLRRTRRPAIC